MTVTTHYQIETLYNKMFFSTKSMDLLMLSTYTHRTQSLIMQINKSFSMIIHYLAILWIIKYSFIHFKISTNQTLP